MKLSTSGWSIRKYQPAPAQLSLVPYEVMAATVEADPSGPQAVSLCFMSKDGSCGPASSRNGGYSRVMNAP